MSLTERERLERMPLRYDVVAKRGRKILKRTVAIGILTDVLADAHRLGRGLAATVVEYSRQKQSTQAPPAGAPQWWTSRVGQAIDAGATYSLMVRGPESELMALELTPAEDP